jgi:hypothetical protein
MTRLSSGGIAGAVIGVAIFVVLVIVGIVWLSKREAAKRHEHSLHIQRERNANKTVRKRDGTLVHGDAEVDGDTGEPRPKIGGMHIGQSYYHETPSETVRHEIEKRV